MINPNLIYNVTGRYMDGQKVVGYHLVGEDGSQAQEGKDRIIWAIGKGIISNMRIQIGNNKEIIIRGKGINLNNLPVYDQKKQQFRNDNVSQLAANTKVPTVKSSENEANPMGQYKILKRIMIKNRCIGYEVQDFSGRITRKKRDTVIKLALQKLISNAVANKYTKSGSNVPELVLRGVDCDLSKLPILIVADNGKIIDPTVETSNLSVRSAYMKRSGIIYNNTDGTTMTFKTGDFIICGVNGKIKIQNRFEVEKEFMVDKELNTAVCDDYLFCVGNYSIELLGNKPIKLTENMVKSWSIMKHVG